MLALKVIAFVFVALAVLCLVAIAVQCVRVLLEHDQEE